MQEDLCLMADVDGELRFVSGVVCFPQRWTIGEKIGMNMERIHEPVPRFNQQLGRSVGGFMSRLAPGKPFWRINWAVSDNPDLFQPVAEDLIVQTNSGRPWDKTLPILTARSQHNLAESVWRSDWILSGDMKFSSLSLSNIQNNEFEVCCLG